MRSLEMMPVLFIGHGSPMYALRPNVYTAAWTQIAKQISKPKAILMISAHWYTRGIWLTAMDQPKTIHDFGGFPQELFEIEYPALGSPDLARHIQELLSPTFSNITLEDSEWGLDHGAWSVLKYMYPKADIPVVQMSIDATLSPEKHVAIGQALQSLRHRQVLVISSGNIVHNLGKIVWGENIPPAYWAKTFDTFFKIHLLNNQTSELVDCQTSTTDALLSIPTPEHYLPALYTLGLKHPDESATIICDGIEMSSISMLSFGYGL
jgi:4,5-DOPA dioxygenase extradiol